jgi:hypothetical protein
MDLDSIECRFLDGRGVDRATGKSQGLSEVLAAKVLPRADGFARIEMELSYHPPGAPAVLKESRLIKVGAPDRKGVWRIDWRSTFTAGKQDVLLEGGTAGGGYAGLSVRVSQASADWVLINSEGRRDGAGSKPGDPAAGTHGARARWADFSLVDAAGQTGRIAVLDHPSNPRHRSQWHNIVDARARFDTVCHLAWCAFQLGRPLRWDPASETFPGDPEANRKMTRALRAPWRLSG